MKKYLFLLLACLAVIACEQEEIKSPEEIGATEFSVSVENVESKTSLSHDNSVLWSADDNVSVFDNSTTNLQYIVKSGTEGSSNCTLVYAGNTPAKGDKLTHKVAIYPYNKDITCKEVGNYYSIENITLPTVQQYVGNSFGPNSMPMVAVSNDNKLEFKNICGAIMFKIKGNAQVKSISISGNENEKLSGKATISAYTESTPVLTMADDASKSVTLECKNGVQLSSSVATEFIIALPPTEFKGGFTATVKTADGQTHELSTTKADNKIERSAILIMPEVEITETVTPGGIVPFTTASLGHEGISYIWDDSVIPEITIHITKDEWNKLLKRYDEFDHNVDYFHADFTYKKGDEVTYIKDGGLRLRGNTSRRRPEGNSGQTHSSSNPDWHHCHFGINFRKYNKDKDHEIKGIRKINLKWFKDDPCYVRELYCYDLFRRYGIWTSAFSTYCRLWLQVDNETPAYYGVYEMIEPVDDKYVSKRVNGMFESDEGFLWKCCYGVGGPADLKTEGGNSVPSGKMNWDQDNGVNYTYEFKGDEEDFEAAKIQLGDFMQKLNGKSHGTPGDSFYKWIKEVCDVEFLLKTYAVNVAVGMWDDHWGNGNNFYLYFNSTDRLNYKVFLIPYDYDNTLGTSSIVSDAGRQNPYDWGNSGLLMERLMEYDEFKQIYKEALQELVDPANGLFHMDASVPRIKAWQSMISPYVSNDTGEDMSIYDKPASWGNCSFYRLMDVGSNNYFKVKTETINNMK